MTTLEAATTHTAAKQYRCDAGFTCAAEEPRLVILPGDRYVRVAVPPWTMVQEDHEYPATPLGEWIVTRYHLECYGGQYL